MPASPSMTRARAVASKRGCLASSSDGSRYVLFVPICVISTDTPVPVQSSGELRATCCRARRACVRDSCLSTMAVSPPRPSTSASSLSPMVTATGASTISSSLTSALPAKRASRAWRAVDEHDSSASSSVSGVRAKRPPRGERPGERSVPVADVDAPSAVADACAAASFAASSCRFTSIDLLSAASAAGSRRSVAAVGTGATLAGVVGRSSFFFAGLSLSALGVSSLFFDSFFFGVLS
mmetsp:Transcript_17954/g.31416  ORF Transcript_17954/g.31416 Transcript_17954/m.31416 type:complete len:238 (+) Transcript_17954:117-830(+)